MKLRLLFLLGAAVSAAACLPQLTGAACSADENCPASQRCVAGVCELGARGTGGGDATGGGSATGGGAATGGGTATGGGAATGGGTATGGGSATGGGAADAGVDMDPPIVTRTTPTNASTDVSVSTTIEFTFNEPMNPSTVQYLAVPTIAFGAPVWTAGNTVLTVMPTAPLSFNQAYLVGVNGQDVAGNAMMPAFDYSFTTEATPDMTAPTLVSSTPVHNASNVPVTSGFFLTFSEPMNPASVQLGGNPTLTLGPANWANNNTELAIAPTANLAPNTGHVVTVTGADVAGNALAGNPSFSFTTAPPPDTMAPTLQGSTPASGSFDVAADVRLALTFSEPMNTSSLVVTPTPDPGLGTPTWTNGDSTATFTGPVANWTLSTLYSVAVSASDVAGNPLAPVTVEFRTADPPDNMPPTVTSTAPATGATNVPASTNVEFNFSEPMQTGPTQAAFSSTPAITCAFSWNAARTLLTCSPGADLNVSTPYAVTLGTGARDDAGNALAAPYSLSFTTAAAPDNTPPTVTSTTPANNAIGVARVVAGGPTRIAVTFSEPMSQAATQAAFSITSPAGFDGGTFSWAGNTMTYTPPAYFDFGANVTFRVDTGAKDLAGNSLQTTLVRTFRIRRQKTEYLENDPSWGALDGTITSTPSCTLGSYSAGSAVAAAGDRYNLLSNPTWSIYRGYLTFSLEPLTVYDNVTITGAILNATQVSCNGNPFTTSFGSYIEAWHVNYGASLELGDCNLTALGNREYRLSGSILLGLRTANVTASVVADWANVKTQGSRSQFMLRTASATSDGDMTSDYCGFGTSNASRGEVPYLTITYEYD